MDRSNELEQYREVIGKCVRCGSCQAHCPVYDQERSEGSVARGKLSLAKALLEGSVDIEKRLEQDISLCLLCGSCVVKCPNKVPTDLIVAAMRRLVTDNKGLSLTGKAISTVSGSAPLLKTLTKTTEKISSSLFKQLPENSGMRLRFPLPGMQQRTFPTIAPKSLFEMFPEVSPGDKKKPVVGIFAGCSISYLFPHIGEALINLLKRCGYTVVLPKTQRCCGLPARSAGAGKRIEQLAKINFDTFASTGVDYILTACASCNSGLSQSMKTDNYHSLQEKITDIHVFFHQQGIIQKLKRIKSVSPSHIVTYHDPCHLKSKGITQEPRLLLQALPGVEFVEMENADWCCGLGGTFSVYHYNTSKAIGQKKMIGLKNSGAECIATGCPGCMIQLQDAINHYGLNVKVIHTLELTDQVLALLPPDQLL